MTAATQSPLITGDSALVRTFAKSYEWYTPARYIEAARQVLGSIDRDPASCAEANKIVQATTYYDKATNGLAHDWPGTVWLNQPYCRGAGNISNQDIWTCRLIAQYEAGITTQAILLVGSSTDIAWFQRLWAYPACFTDHRIPFSCPGGTSTNRSTHGAVFLYLGQAEHHFIEVFSQFGPIVKRVSSVPSSVVWICIELSAIPVMLPSLMRTGFLCSLKEAYFTPMCYRSHSLRNPWDESLSP